MTTQANIRRVGPAVIDVDEDAFEQEVIARSHEVPVVVDFWATWCGPCRTLGPMLERLAEQARGAFVLAKVNVDANQRLAGAYQVQSIPAVKAFRDGRVVDEFVGALPEPRVRDWLRKLSPTAADRLVAQAAELETVDQGAAETRYREALAADATHPAALLGLGRLLAGSGDSEASELLRMVPAGTPQYSQAQAWLTLADFLSHGRDADAGSLAAAIAVTPDDLGARYQLAAHHARQREYADAIAQLLAILGRNRSFRDDGARRALLALFDVLGNQDPLVVAGRRQLANMLF